MIWNHVCFLYTSILSTGQSAHDQRPLEHNKEYYALKAYPCILVILILFEISIKNYKTSKQKKATMAGI